MSIKQNSQNLVIFDWRTYTPQLSGFGPLEKFRLLYMSKLVVAVWRSSKAHFLTSKMANFIYFCQYLGLGGCGSFFKLIFALKPWDQDGYFEYNRRNKQSNKSFEKFVHLCQKLPQKPKSAGILDLIWQKEFLSGICDPVVISS